MHGQQNFKNKWTSMYSTLTRVFFYTPRGTQYTDSSSKKFTKKFNRSTRQGVAIVSAFFLKKWISNVTFVCINKQLRIFKISLNFFGIPSRLKDVFKYQKTPRATCGARARGQAGLN